MKIVEVFYITKKSMNTDEDVCFQTEMKNVLKFWKNKS